MFDHKGYQKVMNLQILDRFDQSFDKNDFNYSGYFVEDGEFIGESHKSQTIALGIKVGLTLNFDENGTGTVSAYRDGVWVGSVRSGLPAPLCPSVWLTGKGQCVDFVSSNYPKPSIIAVDS